MAALADRMSVLSQTGRDAVVCGDWNVAHTENDIKNGRGNVKKSGFLPSERQWLTELLASGWVDVVRRAAPGRAGGGGGEGSTRRRLAHRTTSSADAYGLAARASAAAGRAGRGVCAALVRPRTGDGRVPGVTVLERRVWLAEPACTVITSHARRRQ